jgi:hypothetical protein
MLASEGARYFRNRFVQHNIEEFKKDVDITKGKNFGQSEDVVVQFVANAYVGVVECYPPRVMAVKVGKLLDKIV